MRVTGGNLAGRRLQRAPAGVRPSGDRLRESLFARLGSCEGLRVLDLYAGTGTLGIEALSRGALEVIFVERGARSLAALRANLRALDLEGRARVLRGEVRGVLRRQGRVSGAFDLVLLDPPLPPNFNEAGVITNTCLLLFIPSAMAIDVHVLPEPNP